MKQPATRTEDLRHAHHSAPSSRTLITSEDAGAKTEVRPSPTSSSWRRALNPSPCHSAHFFLVAELVRERVCVGVRVRVVVRVAVPVWDDDLVAVLVRLPERVAVPVRLGVRLDELRLEGVTAAEAAE